VKQPAKASGKLPADGRLAGSHQANEVNIAAIVHNGILADAKSLLQKTKAGKAGP
jgi:hypothetical protein